MRRKMANSASGSVKSETTWRTPRPVVPMAFAMPTSSSASAVIDELPRVGRITFRRLTDGLVERLEVIVRFLAVLELFKQGLIDVDQADAFGEIELRWLGEDGLDRDDAGDRVRVAAGAIDDYDG